MTGPPKQNYPEARGGQPWRELDAFSPAIDVTADYGAPTNPNSANAKCDRKPIMDLADDADGDGVVEYEEGAYATGLPKDECHKVSSCNVVNNNPSIGDANWDYLDYFIINHGCDPAINPTCKPADWPVGANWPPDSRYHVYRYEIEVFFPSNVVTPDQPIAGLPDPTEEDGDMVAVADGGCFKGTPPNINPDYDYDFYPQEFPIDYDLVPPAERRIFPVAIANCHAIEAAGDLKAQGKFTFLPVQLLFIFVTEPMGKPGGGADIFVEPLGVLDDEQLSELSKKIVQIYRR